jgi:PilZ domain
MDAHERRRETRVDVRIPLRFRPMANLNVPEQKAESVNVSPLGVYFTTDFPLAVGARLVLWMTMPPQVTAGESRDVRCVARVVHVEPTGRLVRKVGVGLRIESFASAARVERWAS